MNGKKIMATIVVLALVFSTMVVINQVTDFKLVRTAGATTGSVTYNGAIPNLGLTSGEIIAFNVVDNSLEYGESYALGVWNGTHWIKLEEGTADYYGDISIDFHVPWWGLLGKNPVTNSGHGNPGEWNIRLFNVTQESSMEVANYSSNNVTLTIGNIFEVTFTEQGVGAIDHIMFNKTYGINNQFGVSVRNFTGATYINGNWDDSNIGDTYKLDYKLFLPNGAEIAAWGSTNKGRTHQFPLSNGATGTGYSNASNYENFFWVWVARHGANAINSTIPLPCKLNVSWHGDAPSDLVWGTDRDVNFMISVRDGNGNLIETPAFVNYPMAMYAPKNGGFVEVNAKDTYTGFYIYNGLDTRDFSAGFWYIGTDVTTPNAWYRIKEFEPNKPAGLPDTFIPYLEFEVATYEKIGVRFETRDDVITGFDQTINISIENKSGYNNLVYDNLNADHFHITGLRAWNSTTNTAYERTDIVPISEFGATSFKKTRTTDERAYYTFVYRFNETGTARIIVSHPGNQTHIENQDSYYSNTYNNEYLRANWTGTTTFSVGAAGNLNMKVRGEMPDKVNVVPDGNLFKNQSQEVTIDFYGRDTETRKNVTLHVSGCGLDYTIKETDKFENHDQLVAKGNGWYTVKIEPKIGGTLTITATNGTDSVSRDYQIAGLTGSITTSIGDDLEIEVTRQEKITVEVKSRGGHLIETANVYVSLYNWEWQKGNSKIAAANAKVNDSNVDDVDGDDGIYEFIPPANAVHDVGYLVVAAESGGNWMYDIVEIVAIEDIAVKIIDPSEVINQTLTVGIDRQTLEIEIRDPEGNILKGSAGGNPTVTGYLIDEQYPTTKNPRQTLTFVERTAQNKWILSSTSANNFPYWPGTLIIEVINNTNKNEHKGVVEIPVEFATITYSPSSATAGIGMEEVEIEVAGIDAVGRPLNGVRLYLWRGDQNFTATPNRLYEILLDEDGLGTFEIAEIGNKKTHINATLRAGNYTLGNNTIGRFNIDFPTFTLVPDTIYIGQSNFVEVTAKDSNGVPLSDINITFMRDGLKTEMTPTPVRTDANGKAIFSLNPTSSGEFNVTIIEKIIWLADGTLDWKTMDENKVVTTTVLVATSFMYMDISAPASVNEGESFTVTLTRRGTTSPVAGALVTFNAETKTTGAQGTVTFDAPSVRANLNYQITAKATGYLDVTATILVINLPQIFISVPEDAVVAGERFEIVAGGDDGNNVGIQVTFNGVTRITSATGTVTFTAPAEEGTYPVTATKEGYQSAEPGEIEVISAGIPGFEVLTLIAALGVAFILLKKRRQQ